MCLASPSPQDLFVAVPSKLRFANGWPPSVVLGPAHHLIPIAPNRLSNALACAHVNGARRRVRAHATIRQCCRVVQSQALRRVHDAHSCHVSVAM